MVQLASSILFLLAAGAQLVSAAPAKEHEGYRTNDDQQQHEEKKGLANGIDLRIMPLGASITFGARSSDGNGYRGELHELLTKGGNKVDMVGRQHGGKMKDNENEGYPGAIIDEVHKKAKEAVPKFKPNLVLINLGTNDANYNKDIDHAGDRMQSLINDVFKESPHATVFLSNLLPRADKTVDERVRKMNQEYHDVVRKLEEEKKRIVWVDLRGPDGVQVSDLSDDGIHPKDQGYQKMAKAWYQAIKGAAEKGLLQKPE